MNQTNMIRLGIVTGVLAAGAGAYLAAAPDAEIPEGGICELHTVFAPCADLLALPGAEHVPACEGTETVGAVLALKLLPGDEEGPALDPGWLWPPGLYRSPVDCDAYEWPEERVQVVPVATMHPESVAGIVGRHATGEGEWATPEAPPAPGYCYGAGCYCAGEPCEHVAIGAVDPCYWSRRLHRLMPEAPYTDDCPGPGEPEAEPEP